MWSPYAVLEKEMKLLLTGDWHITNTPPEKRIDNYTQAQSWKFLHILGLAEEKNCTFIIQPGDFFDSHKANDFLKRAVIKLLRHKTSTNLNYLRTA